jgi:hypothetical protein
MAKAIVFKPSNVGKNDNYQTSSTTTYSKDQTTGELFKTSGTNVRTIIPEMFNATLAVGGNTIIAHNTTQTVYTVPAGYTLIISSLCLSASVVNGGGVGIGRVYLYLNGNIALNLIMDTNNAIGTLNPMPNQSVSITPTALLILRSNQNIQVSTDNLNTMGVASFTGYIIKNSDILF